MSVKPVAWMYTQNIEGIPAKFNEPILKNVRIIDAQEAGYTETVLYDAPAPELAEALQRLVEWDSVGKSLTTEDHKLREIIADSISLLARITPK